MIRDQQTLDIVLDSIDRFVRDVLAHNEHLVAETDAIPPAIVAQMRALGLFGLSIPEQYGGLHLTVEEEVRLAFVLGHASPAFRSLIGTNNGIGSHGIIVDGTKRYITNAPQAGIFTVMARTDPARRGAAAISAFIAENDSVGLTLGKIDQKMGQLGAHTCDVLFENCRVPASAIIGGKEGSNSASPSPNSSSSRRCWPTARPTARPTSMPPAAW